jgi:electron transport complex protein RnfD
MFDVLIACLPIFLFSAYFFGLYALLIVVISIFTAKFTELVIQVLFKAKAFDYKNPVFSIMESPEVTVLDGSAALTGLLLAFTLPPSVPLWIPAVGSAFSIAVGKHIFGGLGYNIFNPALVGRAFLLAAWPVYMTDWRSPINWIAKESAAAVDAVTTATPLSAMKLEGQATSLLDLFIGNTGGSLGAAYLLYKGTITWHIPFSYIGTAVVFALLTGNDPVFHFLSGGLLLGAFFMATDVVTSPVTITGRLIFGCCAGLITMIIRCYGGYPEGVCYSILIMNAFVPLIDRYTQKRVSADEINIPLVDKILD